MPLPSNGLPTPLSDMKDLYGIAEPDNTSSSKSQSESEPKATENKPASSSKLSSLLKPLLGKKGAAKGPLSPEASDSQVTLTATPASAPKTEAKADA